MGKLDGKAAIITGGGSGFGRGACLLWAQEGARVAVADLDAAAGRSVVEEITAAGGEAIFVQADVSVDAEARMLVRKTVEAFGGLQVLYNNVGILGTRGVYLTEFDDAVARRLIDVNFMGVYYPVKHALPEMIRGGGGSIISTGSESAFQGNTGFSVYSATKAAVLAFSRVVAMEYVDRGIRANTVSPGAGRTPMHADLMDGKSDLFERVEQLIPMKRAAEPVDVARAALFFASDDSQYITGTNLMVDGGWTVRGYF
jgi:NAD(P)-dependent dehydrogenase (short-subunit alcohol dehydrogenase family)